MRLRLPLGRRALLIAAFVIALIISFPMRLALGAIGLGDSGVSAREVRGSVWFGRLTEARAGTIPLGDVSASLSPVQLLVGRARVDLDGKGPDGVRGAVGVSRNSFGIDDVTAKLQAGSSFAPLPLSTIDLTDLSVRFADGQCQRASGRVRANLEGALAGVRLGGGLTGNARCDGGALLLPLVGESGMEQVMLRIRQGGRFTADIAVRQGDGPGFSQTIQGTL